MIGEQTQAFSLTRLRTKLNDGKIQDAKNYITEYFAKVDSPVGVLFWKANESMFIHYTFEDCKKLYLNNKLKVKQVIETKDSVTTIKFDAQSWFFDEHDDIYSVDIDPSKPKTYERRGAKYINLFAGYAVTSDIQPFDTYSDEIKEALDIINNHVKDVLCSGNDDNYEYFQDWIASMVCGIKMKSILYLKCKQGAGKSIFFEDFLQNKILGLHLCHTTDKQDAVTGNFNAELRGKLLLIFEEAPSDTAGKWMNFSNSLKHIATGNTLRVSEKYKTPFECKNTVSVIVITNMDAVKIDPEDRRFYAMDVSEHRIKDYDYFDKLADAINTDGIGEAFMASCRERIANRIKKFDEMKFPKTQSKKELVIENLPDVYKYIKSAYLENHNGINMRFGEFYDDYTMTHHKKLSKIKLSKLLTDINIEIVTKGTPNDKTSTAKCISVEYDELYTIFNERGWIHDIDDIEKPKPKVVNKKSLKKDEKSDPKVVTKKPLKTLSKPADKQKTYASDDDDMFDELDKVIDKQLTMSFD
jgi:hypothetical protein